MLGKNGIGGRFVEERFLKEYFLGSGFFFWGGGLL
jgi:hypothetical protein